MRIAVLAPDAPFPANRGGRVDVWRRICGMTELGHQVDCVFCSSGAQASVDSAQRSMAEARVSSYSYPHVVKPGDLAAITRRHGWLPPSVLRRTPSTASADAIHARLRDAGCDLLVLEGPWLGALAMELARRLQVPLVYRSHNIEHQYMRQQARLAKDVGSRIRGLLTTIGLERWERRLIHAAQRVWDISADDRDYWHRSGWGHVDWLPPLADPTPFAADGVHGVDLLYVGNLWTPNNVAGVRRLIEEIFPAVLERRPQSTLTVVGSSPRPDLRRLIERDARLRLVSDVPDVRPYMAAASVLLNPVQFGSGVQLKSVDMLMTDRPIVTTSQGVRGLNPSVRQTVCVADEVGDFVAGILRVLAEEVEPTQRARVQRFFSVEHLRAALSIVEPRALAT